MFKDLLSKIVAGIATVLGAMFLYQKHKTNSAQKETEVARKETEGLKVEMRVEKVEQELQTKIIEGKMVKSAVQRKKIIDEALKNQQETVSESVKETKDGEAFTFRS